MKRIGLKILDIKVLRGPNIWSNFRKNLIVFKLDIGEYECKPTNKISGFYEKIKEVLPSMHLHQCSYHEAGGFFRRVYEGTWAGHVIEHIALELQSLAGMSAGYGRTRGTGNKGIYYVVFAYKDEEAGLLAGEAAINLFLKLSGKTSVERLNKIISKYIKDLKNIYEKNKLGPSTASIIKEAEKRKIPFIRLNNDSFVQLGYGSKQKRIEATISSNTAYISVNISDNKETTKTILKEAGIPVPEGIVISEINELKESISKIKYPLVIKPFNGNQGKGVTTNIPDITEARRAFLRAKRYSPKIIIEKYIDGRDFRILIVDKKLCAAAERIPAHVIGDGENSVYKLVEIINNDPWRGNGHNNILTKIILDHNSKELLRRKNYNFNTVLPKGEVLYLKTTANLSTGGTAINKTNEIHSYNKFIFERAASIIGLDICGIDVVAKSLSDPLDEQNGAVIEVNSSPGFRMHLAPSFGEKTNVAKNVVDMLFPGNEQGRIPIFSITGTNGKTTTTRLIAHALRLTGKNVGYTTTDGSYINDILIEKGDNSGPISARKILKDPSIDAAVFETARGGILRSGLGFDSCNIGIVINVKEDHLGLNDINTLEQMAEVKSVVVNSVRQEGYSILNADDNLVLKMRDDVISKVGLFSMFSGNYEVLHHVQKGGVGAVIENGFLTILDDNKKIIIEKVHNIPLSFGGTAEFMIENILAASLALYCSDHPVEDIRKALMSFIPDEEKTPGRLNIFKANNFSVIIDYAHNPAGFKSLGTFLKQYPCKLKTGIFGATGDRRDQDIKELGRIAAEMFDTIILKEDYDLRGRKTGEATELLIEGIKETRPDMNTKVINDEDRAIDFALKHIQNDELLVILAFDIENVIKKMKEAIKEESFIRKEI